MSFLRTASMLVCIALLYCTPASAQTGKAFLVICDQAPGQLIVLDDNGNWVPNVKSITVTIAVNGTPELTTIQYAGVIEPTNPKTQKYELAQIKSMPKTEFMAMIDGLQGDPSFVKNSSAFAGRAGTTVRQPPVENSNRGTNNGTDNGNDNLDLNDQSSTTPARDDLVKVVIPPSNVTASVLFSKLKQRFGDKLKIESADSALLATK